LSLTSTQTATGGERPLGHRCGPLQGWLTWSRLITRVGHAGVHVNVRVSGERGDVAIGVDLPAVAARRRSPQFAVVLALPRPLAGPSAPPRWAA
jgi:hypothetical protein